MDPKLSSKMVPVQSNMFEEVRFFSDESIQKNIDNALKGVPYHSVILKADVDGSGKAKAVLAARPGEHWTIAGVFEYDFSDKTFSGGAEVAFEW